MELAIQKRPPKAKSCVYAYGILLVLTGLLIHSSAWALIPETGNEETITVRGQVIDRETEEPIIGANIFVLESVIGTTSDENGNFTLQNVPESARIRFSYVGYRTLEIASFGSAERVIALEPSVGELDELVVVAYGSQMERSVTGSISQIRYENLDPTPSNTFTDAFSGRIPGVQVSRLTGDPAEAPSIRIRGTGSITAGNEPLYVVDGFPVSSGAIDNVNPSDIETVTILKDAAATAIYGSRGSNGVILVTTKRGQIGRPQVTFNSSLGLQQVSKRVDVLTPQEYAELKIESSNNGWAYLGNDPNDPNELRDPFYRNSPYLFQPELWPDTDWQDEIFQVAPVQNYELSVSGGDPSTRYRVSIGYKEQDGIIRSTSYDRFTLSTSADTDINNRLNLSVNLSYADINQQAIQDHGTWNRGLIGDALGLPGFFLPQNEDGSYPDHRGFGFGVSAAPNPMARLNEETDTRSRSHILAGSVLSYQITPNMYFRSSLNIERTSGDRNYFRRESRFGNPMVDHNGAGVRPSAGAYSSSNIFTWLSESTLRYNFELGEAHSFSLLGGFTAQHSDIKRASISANNFPNNLVPTLNAGEITGASTIQEEWSLLSYLTRVNYDFKNRYFFSTTLRADGSSRFGPNRKWGIFPSFSAGWMISDESFLSDLETINFLKLRASYGISGNDAIPNYGAIGLLGSTDYAFGGNPVTGLAQSSISNANLGWESSEQVNIGFDMGLWNDRINLKVDVYEKTNRDLLLNVNVPSIMGFGSALQNIGKVRNRGLEIDLTTRNLRGALNWTTNFNIAFNRNKVLALGPEGDPIISRTYGTTTHITQVGRPIGEFYGYIWDGIFNSQEEIDNMPSQPTDVPGFPIIRDVNGDGIINADDRTVIGNNHPDYVFGFENSFRYRRFDLNIMVQGVMGLELMNIGKRQTMILTMRTNQLGEARNRWQSPEEPGNGMVPMAIIDIYGLRRETSTFYVEDASFVRVRYITFGYNLPESLLGRAGIQNSRVYISAENPFTFSNNTGYNPEVNTFNNPLTPGTEDHNFPLARTVTMGVSLGF